VNNVFESPAHDRRIDLDRFYSAVPIEIWRQVLGQQLHYHHGIWDSDEDWQTALENAVFTLARHLKAGDSVLDLGCGWGGPALLLRQRFGCSTLCVTVSSAQAAYCAGRGLQVRHANLDREVPEGAWSVGWWLESLEHLEQPETVLLQLRSRCERLIIRVNTSEVSPRRLFARSMPMRPMSHYLDALKRAGWRVTHLENRRAQSIRSPLEWLVGLSRANMAWPADPHLRALWDYSVSAITNPSMYAGLPLIDIVAE
jgi:hypothetical protein